MYKDVISAECKRCVEGTYDCTVALGSELCSQYRDALLPPALLRCRSGCGDEVVPVGDSAGDGDRMKDSCER